MIRYVAAEILASNQEPGFKKEVPSIPEVPLPWVMALISESSIAGACQALRATEAGFATGIDRESTSSFIDMFISLQSGHGTDHIQNRTSKLTPLVEFFDSQCASILRDRRIDRIKLARGFNSHSSLKTERLTMVQFVRIMVRLGQLS